MIIDLITWFFVIFNIFGTILNIKLDYRAFAIWTICNIFWLVYDFFTHQYARLIADCVNLATSTWGLVEWYRNFQDKNN